MISPSTYSELRGQFCDLQEKYSHAIAELEELKATIHAQDANNPSKMAMFDVLKERYHQDMKWGEQNHDPFTYLTILGEEYGEACQAALHNKYADESIGPFRSEMVQVAAVALAIVECIDRGKWAWPEVKGSE